MNNIRITIEYKNESLASIIALIQSIRSNMNSNVDCEILLLDCDGSEESKENKIQIQDSSVKYYFEKEGIKFAQREQLANIGRVLFLRANTLLLNDITEMFGMDLENKKYGMSLDYPKLLYRAGNNEGICYNDSVILTDGLSLCEYLDVGCKNLSECTMELPITMNYGLCEMIQNEHQINKTELNLTVGFDACSVEKVLDNVQILRFDKEFLPKDYCDAVFGREWSQYVKKSGICVEDNRGFYADTYLSSNWNTICGGALNDSSLVKIQIFVSRFDFVYGLCLLKSIRENMDESSKIIIRILYDNLQLEQIQMLLSLADNKLSVALFNSSLYSRRNDDLGISAKYEDIWLDSEGYLIVPAKSLCVKALGKQVCDLTSFYCFQEDELPWSELSHIYSQKLRNYLSGMPNEEKLLKNAICLDGEEIRMKDLQQRIKELETQNATLTEELRGVQKENKTLLKERDKYIFELTETRESITYKIGRIITALPRKIKGN